MTDKTLREAVAVRFDFDGYGYQYMDAGSGSDWLTRKPDAEPLFTADTIEALQARVDVLEAALCPRDLETAPKDGTYFLMLGSNFDGGAAVVSWDADLEWWTLDDGKNPEIMLRNEAKLTDWLPLPRQALEGKTNG